MVLVVALSSRNVNPFYELNSKHQSVLRDAFFVPIHVGPVPTGRNTKRFGSKVGPVPTGRSARGWAGGSGHRRERPAYQKGNGQSNQNNTTGGPEKRSAYPNETEKGQKNGRWEPALRGCANNVLVFSNRSTMTLGCPAVR